MERGAAVTALARRLELVARAVDLLCRGSRCQWHRRGWIEWSLRTWFEPAGGGGHDVWRKENEKASAVPLVMEMRAFKFLVGVTRCNA